jgi:hypothetical protein
VAVLDRVEVTHPAQSFSDTSAYAREGSVFGSSSQIVPWLWAVKSAFLIRSSQIWDHVATAYGLACSPSR